MQRGSYLKQVLSKQLQNRVTVIGIIILLTTITFQPIINAQFINSNIKINDFVIDKSLNVTSQKIIFQMCNSDKLSNYSMEFNEQQIKDLNFLIDDFKEKLDVIDTYEETVIIYEEMIESLYEHNLLPEGLTVDKAKDLIINQKNEVKYDRFSSKLSKYFDTSEDDNTNCLIASNTTATGVFGPAITIGLGLALFRFFICFQIGGFLDSLYYLLYSIFPSPIIGEIISIIADILTIPFLARIPTALLIALLGYVSPLKISATIGYGLSHYNSEGTYYSAANGWLNTNGDKGKKNWEGKFWGEYGTFPFFPPLRSEYYAGVRNFSGLMIYRLSEGFYWRFIMGKAASVNVDYNRPD